LFFVFFLHRDNAAAMLPGAEHALLRLDGEISLLLCLHK